MSGSLVIFYWHDDKTAFSNGDVQIMELFRDNLWFNSSRIFRTKRDSLIKTKVFVRAATKVRAVLIDFGIVVLDKYSKYSLHSCISFREQKSGFI